jgi:hypothetical protein
VLTLPMASKQEGWRCWCSSADCRRPPAW